MFVFAEGVKLVIIAGGDGGESMKISMGRNFILILPRAVI